MTDNGHFHPREPEPTRYFPGVTNREFMELRAAYQKLAAENGEIERRLVTLTRLVNATVTATHVIDYRILPALALAGRDNAQFLKGR